MDVRSLLYGFRPATRDDLHRKALALRSGFVLSKARGYKETLSTFVEAAGEIGTCCFGNDGFDSYATTSLSVISVFQPGLDPFLSAVLNDIVLQMNFQSRQIVDGITAPPEVVVFDGPDEYFPVAMIHGNYTGGILVGASSGPVDLPEWAHDNPLLEISANHIARSHLDHLEQSFANLGRNRLGALLLLLEAAGTPISMSERFASIGQFATRYTIYCIAGGAEAVLAAADNLLGAYPQMRLDLRLYDVRVGGAIEYRAIAIAHGLPHIPDVTIDPAIRRPMRFIKPMTLRRVQGVAVIDYFNKTGVDHDQPIDIPLADIGGREPAPLRRPFLLSSSAPLPSEARQRVSDPLGVFHSLAVLEGGILMPSQDANVASYLHATGNGEIMMDFGDESSRALATPLYKSAQPDQNGDLVGMTRTGRLLRVTGAAMPLMFTPMLHKWYSHFIIQCLPRVRIARDIGRAVKLLIPDDLRTKQIEMLSILGFGEDCVVRIPPGAFVQADELMIPRAWCLAFTPYSASVYDEIADHFDSRIKRTPRRILISRESRKTWRNMLNYESVKMMLTVDYGFEVIAPETLTLEDEVAIYSNADIVVGAEGAGMYGAIFAKPGSIYLTLCDEDYVMPILATLAHIRDIDIGYIFGEGMRADADVQRRLPYGHADFVVDIERVEQAVEAAIARIDTRSC